MAASRIYLDHAATTPLDPAVRDAIATTLEELPGNPSSLYAEGRAARDALDAARAQVADVLLADPGEIVFTSGGSEGAALAIRGTAFAAAREGRRHLVTTAVEHHAVLHTVQLLAQRHGFEATVVPVDSEGLVDPGVVVNAVRPNTSLVSVMYANNEMGAVQPIAEIASALRDHPALVHTDAVQAPGSLPIDIPTLGVDLLSIAAHKFYGPKGVGVLFVRRGARLSPQIVGGSQERNRRAGTENVAFAVGLGTALERAEADRPTSVAHNVRLRDQLIEGIVAIPGSRLNGPRRERLPNNVNVCFTGVDSESLLIGLDAAGIAASSGSACTSASLEPSHVLLAMGIKADLAAGSLRLTTGRRNTEAEIERTLEVLHALVPRSRRATTRSTET
ncbi:MAG: cysteine desulfurase family protein [Chloroflexota bacterium]|nr:cysteine desulfurase family protein [Chloroflexota bacterium]MDE2919935.1 cysteine desulfurase family protein [Chloroflexota bacterium]